MTDVRELVRVKPLTWYSMGTHHIGFRIEADAGHHCYVVRFDAYASDDTCWMLFLPGSWVGFPSEKEAVDHANKHHAARIIDMLEPVEQNKTET